MTEQYGGGGRGRYISRTERNKMMKKMKKSYKKGDEISAREKQRAEKEQAEADEELQQRLDDLDQ